MPHIRRINTEDAKLYRDVRLTALSEDPHAFCTTFEEASQRSLESWQEQTEATATGSDQATFFAIDQDSPVGLAAIYRDLHAPEAGDLYQVWVSAKFRGTGLAQKLIQALLTWASENQFMEVKCQISSNNEEIVPFYEGLGFVKGPRVDGDLSFKYKLQPSHPD